jgi:nicotinate phosphoribosyltransferase
MKLKPIINSLLVEDLYKFSMGQCAQHQFNKDWTVWAFKCRNNDVHFTEEMVQEIKEQIDHFCSLRFTNDELDWMRKNIPWLSEDYISNLRLWHPWRDEIFINDKDNQIFNACGLTIEARGRWVDTSMFEIPVLAIVNEVYFAFKYGVGRYNENFKRNTDEKLSKLVSGEYKIGTFSEFGLRRRYSSDMQDWLIGRLTEMRTQFNGSNFLGTSNVYLAKKYNIRPVGTMAHEIIQVMQGHREYNPAYSNMLVMKAWEKEYGVDNGIFLTDCITTDCFLKDFNKKYATLFNGVRHDSGCPFEWGNKIISHYKKLGINPKTKTLLFSDSLDFAKADVIYNTFQDDINVAFGIGTYLSNDLGVVNPLNIVMKVMSVNGSPVAKISDTPGKTMCLDYEYVEYLKRCIDWRLKND